MVLWAWQWAQNNWSTDDVFLRQLVVIVPNAKTVTVCFHVLCWASNFYHCFSSNSQLCGFYADWKNQSEKTKQIKIKAITVCSHVPMVTSMTFTHSSPSWFPHVHLWFWSKIPFPRPSLSLLPSRPLHVYEAKGIRCFTTFTVHGSAQVVKLCIGGRLVPSIRS